MTIANRLWTSALGILLLSGAAQAQTATSSSAAPAKREVKIPIQQFKLKNGLRVVLSEDHSSPVYSICISYDVGSRDEKPGHTGFAHLFEHMMFQGSENVGKGEHFILIDINGGDMNGTTNEDRTNYFESLPANQLDLGLFLEADRMKSLAVTQANLDNQRNAVQEERRLRVDNQPYGKTSEVVGETAYDNFGYKHPTIGSMDDLNAASLDDVKSFFKIYYAPNNAALAMVGDFKTGEALAKIKQYFEDIPAQPAPARPDMTEPPQTAERRKTLEDSFAQIPRIDIEYKIPSYDSPDYMPISVAMRILGSGQSSRLYQKLVKEKEQAASVFANAGSRRATGLAAVIALVRPGVKMDDIEQTIYGEIAKLQSEPIADWELEKVRMRYRHDHAQQLSSSLSRAVTLAYYTVAWNDPNVINSEEARLDAVTKEDVLRVAKKYLTAENRTVVATLPRPKTAAGAAGGN
ncbi:MAG TPA: pitrilysin family protein [Candidatus Acidoferrum sp.]|nr:pitrilysin family protein [Candidatus Acidoferrum sp.]